MPAPSRLATSGGWGDRRAWRAAASRTRASARRSGRACDRRSRSPGRSCRTSAARRRRGAALAQMRAPRASGAAPTESRCPRRPRCRRPPPPCPRVRRGRAPRRGSRQRRGSAVSTAARAGRCRSVDAGSLGELVHGHALLAARIRDQLGDGITELDPPLGHNGLSKVARRASDFYPETIVSLGSVVARRGRPGRRAVRAPALARVEAPDPLEIARNAARLGVAVGPNGLPLAPLARRSRAR